MNLTVFLSARDGKNPTHLLRSKKLGEAITRCGHTLMEVPKKDVWALYQTRC